MAYDESVVLRIRSELGQETGVKERKMFGGIAFMLRGNMWCGVLADELMLRVGPELHEKALARAHVRPMDFTGKPMRGFIYVSSRGFRTRKQLRSWLDLARGYVIGLPAK